MSPRIVSLIASSTEIVCALGQQQYLVGISHECDYPSSIKTLPVCTRPKFRTDGTSLEIDQRVKAIVELSMSVYQVDAELVASLQPTHIITQAQCQVCAVSLKDVEEAACALMPSHPQIVSLEPNTLSDVFEDVRRVSAALEVRDAGERLVANLQVRMAEIENKAPLQHARVAFIEWIDPLMSGGNWMPTLVRMAGGENLFGEDGKHSPPLDWDTVRSADPEVMLVAPCGFDIARTLKEMASLAARPGWTELSCVRSNRVFVADGNQFFNRPGPRLVESLEILFQTLSGKTQINGRIFNHEGTGWVHYR